MKNGCPTVKCIILFVVLFGITFYFIPQRAGAVHPARPISPYARKISRDVADRARVAPNQLIPLIVQLNDKASASFEAEVMKKGGRLTGATLTHFNARALEVPAKFVGDLSSRSDVDFISFNRQYITLGHVTATTGADAIRVPGGANTGLDGSGIGIAVLDPGMDVAHTAFLDRKNRSRVVLSRDFTGEARTDDPYGHGTHVASIAAGNGRISNAEFTGIAPNANIINLRVLNASGSGNVISA